MLHVLSALVSLDTPSDDPQAVASALALPEEALRALGARCRRHGEGDILQADLPGDGGQPVLVLCHMDTVFGHGEAARRPFRIEGDRAYGPGVADMKGGAALALALAKILPQSDEPYPDLRFLFTGDEEIGAPRSREVIAQAADDCVAALVLEPGRPGGEVVSARKGVGTFRLDAEGMAAHAGVEPEKGRSAVAEIARRIAEIAALNGTIPGASFNVGVVSGGTRPNVVAGAAHCLVDVRVALLSDMARAEELLKRAALRPAEPDVHLTLTGGFSAPPMEKGEGTTWLLRHAGAAAREIGVELRDVATGGGSDGNRLAARGLPVLDALGPVGGRAHSAEEYLEIPSIPVRGAILAGMLQGIAKERMG